MAHFTPRQMQAIRVIDSRIKKFILYGGAMGGGKSYFLRWVAVRLLMKFFQRYDLRNVTVMLACEDYTSLKDRQLSKIATEFPAWLGTNHTDHKAYGRCYILAQEYGGGIITFRNLDDPSKYASSEFAAILVDELTKNLMEVFNHLRTRLRWPGIPDIECIFLAGTNPGSIGHGWVKQFWMDHVFPPEFIEPVDYRPYFAYIPSRADDNPYLTQAYWDSLATLPDGLRKAFRDGDWNIFVGQAFPEFGPRHVVKPMAVPKYAPIYMVFDWGYGHPFSVAWIWVDADGRGYVFAEWYGSTGAPDVGLRLVDSEIAEGIKQHEKDLGINERSITRIAGPDCWAKKPNYQGQGRGPSTMEVFSRHGLYLVKGDPTRELKIRQFRERLRVVGEEMPMLVFYETCTEALRTIPVLVMDKNNIEDVDTKGEDHCLHGDTVVHTELGEKRIKDLVGTTGRVFTVDGQWTSYHHCRLTRSGAEVVRIIFEDGRSLTCTYDHKFLSTSDEWIEAKHLLDEVCHVTDVSSEHGSLGIRPIIIEPAGKADVYCLDVDHAYHAFAVCGGILVHNCYDALCHFAMARPMALQSGLRIKTETELRIDLLERGTGGYEAREELYLSRQLRGSNPDSIFDPNEQGDIEREIYTRRAAPGGRMDTIKGSGVE